MLPPLRRWLQPFAVVFGGNAGAILIAQEGDADGYFHVFHIDSLGAQCSCFDG